MESNDWDHIYARTDAPPWAGVSGWLEKVVTTENPRPRSAVDVGTGLGDKAWWLAQQGFAVTAIDISKEAIRKAHAENSGSSNPTFHVLNATKLSELHLAAHSIGLVLDLASSQFLAPEDHPEYLETITTILSPRGIFVHTRLEAVGPAAPPWVKHLTSAEQFLGKLGGLTVDWRDSSPSPNQPDTMAHRYVLRSS